jgi:hypothetical protein
MDLILPNDTQRQLILGKNGSGKTRAAVYNLSKRNLTSGTWVVLNHKREELINSIDGAEFIDDLNWVPKKPGLYIYQPLPVSDNDAVTAFMWKLYERERIGLYIDEGYMIDQKDAAMQAILTQGRSKRIPTIILSQRPVWLSRFAVSESEFFQIFQLTDERDRKTIRSFVPFNLEEIMKTEVNQAPKLPLYHSIWYNSNNNQLVMLKPVPDDDTILSRFQIQLDSKRKIFL